MPRAGRATEGTGILPIPGLIRIVSNDDFEAEELWAFEAEVFGEE